MRKIRALVCVLVVLLVITALTACDNNGSGSTDNHSEDENTIHIVTTIFPIYDWTRNITGGAGDIEITMLIDSGADLHSFQPSPQDIQEIADADMFIYIGGESDEWAEEAADATDKDRLICVNLIEALGDMAKEEETAPGMQAEDYEDEADSDEEDTEYDEHVWLSLRNAVTLCGCITDELCVLDPEHSDVYRANSDEYIYKLQALDDEYEKAAEAGKVHTLLFGDRFPFRYLTDDYGLSYYAAFSGCSAETEASFETIAYLAAVIDELDLRHVMTIEGSDGRIAESIIRNTSNGNQDILTLDSMQSVTAGDVEAGADYLDIMRSNLNVLIAAMK